jgi:hypothetical protein
MIAESLIAHGVGDYVLQSDWMANEKTKRWLPAVAHAMTYALPFLVLTRSPLALLVIAGTHAVIDHYRLARHVGWAKNFLAPRGWNPPWPDCSATGYGPDKPVWMAVWLLIITDNVMHFVINAAALTWLA